MVETDCEEPLFYIACNTTRMDGKEKFVGTVDALDVAPGINVNGQEVFQLKMFLPIVEKMQYIATSHEHTPVLIKLRLTDREGEYFAVV